MSTLHTSDRLPGTVGDGDPHLTYYDPTSLLSFVWTGTLTDPIHVQHGGYGEPTIALIDPEPLWTGRHDLPADILAWYRGVCQAWAASWDGPHRLGAGPLVCDNPRPHRPGHGCTYTSSTGSWVDDRHDDGDTHEPQPRPSRVHLGNHDPRPRPRHQRPGYTATLERHQATSDYSADVYAFEDPVGHAAALPSHRAANQSARDIATRDHNQRGPFR